MMQEKILNKVPAVTLGFWIIKILCTTLGETGGDSLSMTWNFGYLASSAIFFSLLLIFIFIQTKTKNFNPWLYWATIVASTTAGTTMADFADRSLGIGYAGGSLMLLFLLFLSLGIWKLSTGTISVNKINNPKAEIFYWITITFSQTLGTALGDWMASTNNLGYLRSSFIFEAALLLIIFLYFKTKISKVLLFWSAFVLTRPLGAVLGDLLDKPVSNGGLNISRPMISFLLIIVIIILIKFLPQRAGAHSKIG